MYVYKILHDVKLFYPNYKSFISIDQLREILRYIQDTFLLQFFIKACFMGTIRITYL